MPNQVTFQYEYVLHDYPESQILKIITWEDQDGEDSADIQATIFDLNHFLAKRDIQVVDKSTLFNKALRLLNMGSTLNVNHEDINYIMVDFKDTSVRIQARFLKTLEYDQGFNYEIFNKL